MLKKCMLVCALFVALLGFTACSDEIEFYVIDAENVNEENFIISNNNVDINIITKTSNDIDEIEAIEEAEVFSEIIESNYVVATSNSPAPFVITGSNLVSSSTAVSNEYLADALFIGDSLLKGFKAFVSPYPDNVIADQNAGLDQIYANKDIYYISPTEQTSLWSAVEQVMPNPEKIYVLIGINGVPGLENEQSMWYYEDLIVKLKDRFPEKVMYFCALTPLTQELSDQRSPSFCTDKLNDFNKQLLLLCESQDVYFLQADEWLKDENGYLLPEYDGGDGMHLNKAGHSVLLEYFKTHTVSVNNATNNSLDSINSEPVKIFEVFE